MEMAMARRADETIKNTEDRKLRRSEVRKKLLIKNGERVFYPLFFAS
jgi:phage pi2 protein 07